MKKPFDSLFWQDLTVSERSKIWKIKEYFLMDDELCPEETSKDN